MNWRVWQLTMIDTSVITRRRREVEQEIVRLKSSIARMEAELIELATAERVMNRLSGTVGDTLGETKAQKSSTSIAASPAEHMTLRDLITGALADAKNEGLAGLKPREIQRRIKQVYGVERDAPVVNTRTWRLWKEDKILNKTDGGVYSLPEEKPADENSLTGTSAGLFAAPVQGREAGPGGGP
jgi:hypothetical protein